MASRWEHVEQAPADPILGVSAAFAADKDPRKLNLGVGAYRTEEGKPLVLNVVKKVERAMLDDPSVDHEYIPIEGLALFREHTAKVLLGESPLIHDGKVATVQALSGTGALRVTAEWIALSAPGTNVYCSDPTWSNHMKIFPKAGLRTSTYRYFDPKTKGVDFVGLLDDISAVPDGSAIVLHTCAHNPTGADLTHAQWGELLPVFQKKNLLAVFDTAYQGYATGDLKNDAYAARLFAEAGLEVIACQSFAKNMGLYGERVGAMNVVCKDKPTADRVLSQLKTIIRAMYSSPPAHGARIASRVLSNPELFAEWEVELKAMSARIVEMRSVLFDRLKEIGCPGDWSHITKQIGMFTFTGLSPAQVDLLTSKHHIYLTRDGRISMAGLNRARIPYLADAILDAVTTIHE